jgi:poly-beta-1,6-N-acetyl-D-glucosamine biosynthesis protein PgaD
MDKPRSRISKTLNQHHITSLKHPLREAIVILISLTLWVYVSLSVLILLTVLFSQTHLIPKSLASYLAFNHIDVLYWSNRLIIIAGFVFVGLFMWSFYNRYRYSKYKRRVYPLDSDDLDILNLKRIDPALMPALKSERQLIFSHNPVHSKHNKR